MLRARNRAELLGLSTWGNLVRRTASARSPKSSVSEQTANVARLVPVSRSLCFAFDEIVVLLHLRSGTRPQARTMSLRLPMVLMFCPDSSFGPLKEHPNSTAPPRGKEVGNNS